MAKKIIILILAVIIVGAIVTIIFYNKKPMQNENTSNMANSSITNELKFTGTIKDITWGIAWDGPNTIEVDDKQIIFGGEGWSGNMIGFDFSTPDQRETQIHSYIGKKAEVYASDEDGVYSISKPQYYVKLLN